jgi:hypothetical protein
MERGFFVAQRGRRERRSWRVVLEWGGDGVNFWMGMVNTRKNHPKLIEIANRNEFI